MKNRNISILFVLILCAFLYPMCIVAQSQTNKDLFRVVNPDHKTSPFTGMNRDHWIQAGEYLLNGAFSHIYSMDDAMKFPKQLEKTYPKNEARVPTEKLEGLCRTLFIAGPLLKENPDLEINGIKVADYYRHQLLNLINPDSPSFIKHRGNGGPSQTLVEFGGLAISLLTSSEILWDPLSKIQKDALAATMLSYGNGPSIPTNWRFFNIFILSFFKDQGYAVNEKLLLKYLDECLAAYRGYGWYVDGAAYDYYSMWAYQLYGAIWSQFYGKKHNPDYADRFLGNISDIVDNYPYMFSKDGKMNMWGRSIAYRFASVSPLAATGFFNGGHLNYGWMRRIASGTLLQFLEHPDFLGDRVPNLGYYGVFDPAVQHYSCRGSVYWCGKAFLGLLLPKDNAFWTEKENNGPWESKLKKGNVYNKFQPGSNILITNYPNSGASEIRCWSRETLHSSENYNKLAYNTEFPWMADGKNGEVSMNYAIKDKSNKWDVLRLYEFRDFEDGIYQTNATLTDTVYKGVRFELSDIPLPNGVLRVDKVTSPVEIEVRLGHYSLPVRNAGIIEKVGKVNGQNINIIDNREYQLAMVPIHGWENQFVLKPTGLHPETDECALIVSIDEKLAKKRKIYITLQLWKKSGKKFSNKELSVVEDYKISDDLSKAVSYTHLTLPTIA